MLQAGRQIQGITLPVHQFLHQLNFDDQTEDL
jgi:hypothetical protein